MGICLSSWIKWGNHLCQSFFRMKMQLCFNQEADDDERTQNESVVGSTPVSEGYGKSLLTILDNWGEIIRNSSLGWTCNSLVTGFKAWCISRCDAREELTLGPTPLLWNSSCNCWETIWDEREGEGSSQWGKPQIFRKPITPCNEITRREICSRILANSKTKTKECTL